MLEHWMKGDNLPCETVWICEKVCSHLILGNFFFITNENNIENMQIQTVAQTEDMDLKGKQRGRRKSQVKDRLDSF